MADDITLQMHKIMDEVTKEAEEALKKGIAKISKETASKLKNSSPRKTGKYASGWSVRQEKDGAIVYNRTKPRLTHLLEKGHVIRNAKGTYGRVSGRPHIKPAEQWAATALPDEIMRNLK